MQPEIALESQGLGLSGALRIRDRSSEGLAAGISLRLSPCAPGVRLKTQRVFPPAEASRIHQAWWVLQARLDSRSSRAGSRCQRVLTLFSGSSSARVRSVISSGFDPRWASWFRSKRFTALRRRWCDSRWKQVLSQTRAVCLSRTLRTHDLVPGD